MAELKYSYTVDVENPTTSHSQAVLLVAPGSTVLDVGAADGSVARPLVARACRVWGVERDPDAAARARGVCERVIVGDLEEMDLQALLAGQRFDYILYLDVLEHLRDPLSVLSRGREHLAPGGRVIVSIPNITHGAVRLSLMAGTFTYTDVGLLDRTHLRFFDRPGAERLVTDAGLRIVERLRVTRGLTETEIPIDPATVPPQVLEQLGQDPDATTYQFIFVAVPGERAAGTITSASLAERLQHRVTELEGMYRKLETHVRSLEHEKRDLQRHIESLAPAIETERSQVLELRAELVRRMDELARRHLELRHLQADLGVKEAFIADLRRTIDADAAAAAQRAARLEEELRALNVFVNSPGFRTLGGVARALGRYPRIYRLLQRIVRGVAPNP